MTTEQYAASVVEKYHVTPGTGSKAHRAADELLPVIKQWSKQYVQGINLSGAYAKNTAITLASPADLLITLSPVPGMTIKNVFWKLFEYLTDRDLRPRTRDVSIQLLSRGLWVDLIPAYREEKGPGDVLFDKKTGAEVHTDVAQHVHLVANSGRQQEICALKIWRERRSLEFPSLYLELTVLKALETERFGQLAENILGVMRYLGNRFVKTAVRDPANPQNVISASLDASAKEEIAKAARDMLYDENWKKMMW